MLSKCTRRTSPSNRALPEYSAYSFDWFICFPTALNLLCIFNVYFEMLQVYVSTAVHMYDSVFRLSPYHVPKHFKTAQWYLYGVWLHIWTVFKNRYQFGKQNNLMKLDCSNLVPRGQGCDLLDPSSDHIKPTQNSDKWL